MKQEPQVRLQKIEAAQKRWQSKLTRASNMLVKLDRQRKRLLKAVASPPKPKAAEPAKPAITESCDYIASAMIQGKSFEQADADLAIPGFLQRKKLDPVAAKIVSEQEENKRLKARGRIAKMKAKQSGETRRMPLQGKAALEAIRAGC